MFLIKNATEFYLKTSSTPDIQYTRYTIISYKINIIDLFTKHDTMSPNPLLFTPVYYTL